MKDSSKRVEKPARLVRKPETAAASRGVETPGTQASRAVAAREQSELFERAAALFHQRDFEGAKVLFEKAAEGPALEVTHAARTHARICEQRILKASPSLVTAEDHYNYGVAMLNERRLETAESHLLQAAGLAPDQDHICYALALCYGLKGDIQKAASHLKRAIELHPRNRSQARNDPDFAGFIKQAPLQELVPHDEGNS